MEIVEVKITGMAITQRYGTLSEGDILRTDAAYAAHLVNEAHAAEYVTPKGGAAPQPDRAMLDAELAKLPGDQVDPDYVVNGMRAFFGDLFTVDDEVKVRTAVVAAPKKPSDGLTIPEIKEALAAKTIEIPAGVTLRADLAALLDGEEAAE